MSKKVKKTVEEFLKEALVIKAEQPHEVPDNWIWTKLQNILRELKNGTTIKQNKDGLGDRVTRIESVQNNAIVQERLGYIAEVNKLKDSDFYEAGDIALSHINSIEHVGKTALINEEQLPLVHGMNLLRLRLYKDKILPKYAQYYMRSYTFRNDIWNRVNRAVNQVSLNQKNLNQVMFPVPPLNEQKRITDKIERLLNKIDEAKQLIDEAKETFEFRRAAILDKAFRGELTANWRSSNPKVTDANVIVKMIEEDHNKNGAKHIKKIGVSADVPHKLPQGWRWVTLGDIFTLTSGGTPKRVVKEYYNGEIPWVKTGEIKWNYISESAEHVSEEGIRNSSAKILPPKTVLVAMYGQGLTRGRAAILNINASCNQAVCALLPNKYVSEKLLFYYFMEGYHRFRQVAKGGNQENLSASVISKFLFPLPPIEEQEELVSKIEKLMDTESAGNDYLNLNLEIDLIKQSVLSKAFRGELGTNDPTEESAIELLKEVIQEQVK